MASLTSSTLVNDNLDGEVSMTEAEYLCSGCRSTWDNARALHHHRTAMLVRGTASEDEDSESSAVCAQEYAVGSLFNRQHGVQAHFPTLCKPIRVGASTTPRLSGETNSLETVSWTPTRQHAGEDHKSYWRKS